MFHESLSMNKVAVELGSEVDRIFFEQNPDRNFRLREAFIGEVPDPRDGDWSLRYMVVAHQVVPGLRSKVAFTSRNHELADSEETAREVFDEIRDRHGGRLPGDDAIEAARVAMQGGAKPRRGNNVIPFSKKRRRPRRR